MRVLKKDKDIAKCKGIVNIGWLDIYDKTEEVQKVFEKIIPVKAELHFCFNEIEYHALSYEFEELAEGEVIPKYEIIIDNGKVKFEKSSNKRLV